MSTQGRGGPTCGTAPRLPPTCWAWCARCAHAVLTLCARLACWARCAHVVLTPGCTRCAIHAAPFYAMLRHAGHAPTHVVAKGTREMCPPLLPPCMPMPPWAVLRASCWAARPCHLLLGPLTAAYPPSLPAHPAAACRLPRRSPRPAYCCARTTPPTPTCCWRGPSSFISGALTCQVWGWLRLVGGMCVLRAGCVAAMWVDGVGVWPCPEPPATFAAAALPWLAAACPAWAATCVSA